MFLALPCYEHRGTRTMCRACFPETGRCLKKDESREGLSTLLPQRFYHDMIGSCTMARTGTNWSTQNTVTIPSVLSHPVLISFAAIGIHSSKRGSLYAYAGWDHRRGSGGIDTRTLASAAWNSVRHRRNAKPEAGGRA